MNFLIFIEDCLVVETGGGEGTVSIEDGTFPGDLEAYLCKHSSISQNSDLISHRGNKSTL